MDKSENRKKGIKGEALAINYLQKKGFKINETNFSTRFGEIDIIAADNETLVFVEAKLKVGDRFGTPEEMITKRKISQVLKMAELYLLKNKELSGKYQKQRIDAVCIVLDEKKLTRRINHYENLEINA